VFFFQSPASVFQLSGFFFFKAVLVVCFSAIVLVFLLFFWFLVPSNKVYGKTLVVPLKKLSIAIQLVREPASDKRKPFSIYSYVPHHESLSPKPNKMSLLNTACIPHFRPPISHFWI
jgi:hypothetical protein